MLRNLMRAAGLALVLGFVTAVPAHAFTWRASSSDAMWASLGGKNVAGAYGTWYVSATTNRVSFYPNVYAATTTEQGAYAQTTTSVSSDQRSWAAGPGAKTSSWNHRSWHQYPKAFTLPGSSGYVKAQVSVGLNRRFHSDPLHTVSLPIMKY